MKLIRYRGEYSVLGRNQAMKMMLGKDKPLKKYVGGLVWPIFIDIEPAQPRGILRGIEASDTVPQGAD